MKRLEASFELGAMRRRLDLAMTLVGRPRVIFLDEPTTGLDPRGRRTMWEIIRRLVTDEENPTPAPLVPEIERLTAEYRRR